MILRNCLVLHQRIHHFLILSILHLLHCILHNINHHTNPLLARYYCYLCICHIYFYFLFVTNYSCSFSHLLYQMSPKSNGLDLINRLNPLIATFYR